MRYSFVAGRAVTGGWRTYNTSACTRNLPIGFIFMHCVPYKAGAGAACAAAALLLLLLLLLLPAACAACGCAAAVAVTVAVAVV